MSTRRSFLKTLASLPLVGSMLAASTPTETPTTPLTSPPPSYDLTTEALVIVIYEATFKDGVLDDGRSYGKVANYLELYGSDAGRADIFRMRRYRLEADPGRRSPTRPTRALQHDGAADQTPLRRTRRSDALHDGTGEVPSASRHQTLDRSVPMPEYGLAAWGHVCAYRRVTPLST